jgi:hypothetical protein
MILCKDLSDEELRTEIAYRLGWSGLSFDRKGRLSGNPPRKFSVNLLKVPDWVRDEKRSLAIEVTMTVRGLRDAYAANLELVLRESSGESSLPNNATVSPRKRCEAALMTLRQSTGASEFATGDLHGS